jgi:hypothetical protein
LKERERESKRGGEKVRIKERRNGRKGYNERKEKGKIKRKRLKKDYHFRSYYHVIHVV